MHQHDRLIITAMRMSVVLRRLAVRCPTGMTNSDRSVHSSAAIRLLRQDLQPSLCLDKLDLPTLSVPHCDSGRVIAPVFQL